MRFFVRFRRVSAVFLIILLLSSMLAEAQEVPLPNTAKAQASETVNAAPVQVEEETPVQEIETHNDSCTERTPISTATDELCAERTPTPVTTATPLPAETPFPIETPPPTATPAPLRLIPEASEVRLTMGESTQLAAEADGAAVVYESADSAIAAVTQEGTITALAAGETKILLSLSEAPEITATVCVIVRAPEAESLCLPYTEIVLGKGQKLPLTEIAVLPEGAQAALSFKSSRKKVVSVSETGVLTAKSTGSAVITVSTDNGISADLKVKVCSAPRSVSLSACNRLGVGESTAVQIAFRKGEGGAWSLSSANTDVLRIENNRLFAISEGKARVTVTTYNGRTASLDVTVYPAPTSASFTSAELAVAVGEKRTMHAVLSEGSFGSFSYASADPSIASVDSATGCITGHAAGTVEILVRTYNGCEAHCAVEVVPAPEKIALPAEKIVIGKGQSFTLVPTALPEGTRASYTYSSKKSSTVSVKADGVLYGRRCGSSVITITAHNGVSTKMTVSVINAPSSVVLKAERTLLGVGETTSLSVALPKYTAAELTYSVSNPSVISLGEDGTVTALAAGIADVLVTTHNGKKSSVRVTVKNAPEVLLPMSAHVFTGVGFSVSFRANLPPNTAGHFGYEIADPCVASVSASGNITGISAGETTVRAAAYNGSVGEALVTVLPAPEEISLPEAELTLLVGQTHTLSTIRIPANAFEQFSCTSSNTKIVRVSGQSITAVGEGSAVITVTTYNGVSTQCLVTVPTPPSFIQLSPTFARLSTDETLLLQPMFSANAHTMVTYRSSNERVATVDANGLVTAHNTGTAIITAQTLNGLRACCIINVNIEDDSSQILDGDFDITYMDIGRNDGILLKCGDEYAFIDSGMRSNGIDAVNYLKSKGITHLKYYIGTHAHRDHVEGGAPIITALDVDIVIVPHSGVLSKIRKGAKTTEEKTSVQNMPYHIMTLDEQLYLGGAKLTCLGPVRIRKASTANSSENNNSLVLRVSYGTNTFLLTGDAMNPEIQEIEAYNPGCLSAQVFKTPHHHGTQQIIASLCRPIITVFCTSASSLPKGSYLSFLRKLGSMIYITAKNRNSHVTITSNGTDLSVQTTK